MLNNRDEKQGRNDRANSASVYFIDRVLIVKEFKAVKAREVETFGARIAGINIMGLFEIILIAVGLSMDAFAVSITLGLSVEEPKIKDIMLPGLYFDTFQALMPTTGILSVSILQIKFSIWITGSLDRFCAPWHYRRENDKGQPVKDE